MPLPALTVILPLIEALPKVVAAAPEFKALFDQFIQGFNDHDQARLKTAYAVARDRSDSAQEDFVDASRGG
jgi:hypothetical protein